MCFKILFINYNTKKNFSHSSYFSIKSNDCTITALPFFHIFGLYILLSCITFKMRMIFMVQFKPDVFLQSIQDHKISKLFIVPSLAVFLAKSPLVQKYDISTVTDLLCGSAPLPKEIDHILRNE